MNQTNRSGEAEMLRLADSFSHQLGVTARRVSQLFAGQYEAHCSLNPAEWRVLSVIAEQGTVSPSAVSVASDMDKVRVSRAVASLVQRGLVKQVTDTRDGRVRQLSLTRKGATTHAAAEPLTRNLETALADGMSKADFAALRKALSLLDAQAAKLSNGAEQD
jgi:DNA-binding MarR family transcriptional regulator